MPPSSAPRLAPSANPTRAPHRAIITRMATSPRKQNTAPIPRASNPATQSLMPGTVARRERSSSASDPALNSRVRQRNGCVARFPSGTGGDPVLNSRALRRNGCATRCPGGHESSELDRNRTAAWTGSGGEGLVVHLLELGGGGAAHAAVADDTVV